MSDERNIFVRTSGRPVTAEHGPAARVGNVALGAAGGRRVSLSGDPLDVEPGRRMAGGTLGHRPGRVRRGARAGPCLPRPPGPRASSVTPRRLRGDMGH